MSKNFIFIFEFVSGGGFSQIDIPSSLFCEGFGMLRAIISDFKKLNFNIATLLDYRITYLSELLRADIIESINNKENYVKKFKKLVNNCHYCFIIAPESSNLLFNLSQIVNHKKKILLSTNIEGIKLGASKINTFELFKSKKLFTPKTYLIPYKKKSLDVDFIIQKFHKFKKPIVIKPNDGVGAESIYYFDNRDQINEFFKQNNQKIDKKRNYIIQEFIEGTDLSASLISTRHTKKFLTNHLICLSVNSQYIKIKNENYHSEYFGGSTPFENYQQIEKKLQKLLKIGYLSKFTGYFGIDFIRTSDNSICFIEINPRLTTSYIGLRNVIDKNIANLILDSKTNSLKSIEFNHKFHSIFTRIELKYNRDDLNKEISNEQILKLTNKIPEIVTPPISLNNSDRFSSFIATKEKDLASSRLRLNKIIHLIQNLDFEIIKPKKIK